MYGCLGFSHSRFFAQPIAALITANGREILQCAVDIAQNKVGLEVIYGDTDSIMINTRINDEKQIAKVRELGETVKREVNRLYQTLELEIDGIFRSMLLLKKKKYAAKTVQSVLPNGEIRYGQEIKGLDLVRRDWCVQSRDTGRFVTEQILSGQETETIANTIFTHLEQLAAQMRSGELTIDKFIITRGLSKHPKDYPDAKGQPHVLVARRMLENDRPVNVGDHIPYVITVPLDTDEPSTKALSMAEKACHPDEIERSGGTLKPDIEWYLTQQILPPISRLCEHIEGMSQMQIAERLGLDGSKFNQTMRPTKSIDDDPLCDYTPVSCLTDAERFKDVEKLEFSCLSCGVVNQFPGVFSIQSDSKSGNPFIRSGFCCLNPACDNPTWWGHANLFELLSRLSNTIVVWTRGLTTKYYQGWVRCDEPCCHLQTRQLSVTGGVCLRRGCQGRMESCYTEKDLHSHLKYLERAFDVDHQWEQIPEQTKQRLQLNLPKSVLSADEQEACKLLHQAAQQSLNSNAFNWITPHFWQGLFFIPTKQ